MTVENLRNLFKIGRHGLPGPPHNFFGQPVARLPAAGSQILIWFFGRAAEFFGKAVRLCHRRALLFKPAYTFADCCKACVSGVQDRTAFRGGRISDRLQYWPDSQNTALKVLRAEDEGYG